MCFPLSALLALTCSSAPGPAQEMATAPSAVEPVRALAAELGTSVGLHGFRDLGIPLFVTENGMADAEGSRRSDYLRSHVYAVEQAVKEGVDVRGYFHWSLMDNFEWAEGYTPRFGLFRVDFSSPDKPRAPTPAVEGFQDIARNLGLTPGP